MLGTGVAVVVIGDGSVDGAGGTGGGGGMTIATGSGWAGVVEGGVVGSGDRDAAVVVAAGGRRGAVRVVAGTGLRACAVDAAGVVAAREVGAAGAISGGAASWSTTAEPGARVGSDRPGPRVSQPITAHNIAWPTTRATAMRTMRRTLRVTGTGSTCRTLWQVVDVVES